MPGRNVGVIRRALGAGRWFPGTENELSGLINQCLDEAEGIDVDGRIVSAIVPHAGFIYSGRVAGYSFRAIRDHAETDESPETVVIAGFSHRSVFKGVALMDGARIRTPLGDVEIDQEANRLLVDSSKVIFEDYSPHQGEHSAENEIPFVQAALPEARVVVAIMGDHDMSTVDAFVAGLKALSQEKKILFIASTDLLHDADYDKVKATDRKTLEQIADMDVGGLVTRWTPDRQICCGIMPVITAIRFAEIMGVRKGSLLYSRNSGDDFPESKDDWVVGYGAVVFAVK